MLGVLGAVHWTVPFLSSYRLWVEWRHLVSLSVMAADLIVLILGLFELGELLFFFNDITILGIAHHDLLNIGEGLDAFICDSEGILPSDQLTDASRLLPGDPRGDHPFTGEISRGVIHCIFEFVLILACQCIDSSELRVALDVHLAGL